MKKSNPRPFSNIPHRRFERSCLAKNKNQLIAGCDEVGRGALAGPVVVAIVVWQPDIFLSAKKPKWAGEIKDSKLLSSQKRTELFSLIEKKAHSYALGIVSEKMIDKINILQATKLAVCQAAEKLHKRKIFFPTLFLDNLTIPTLPPSIEQKSLVKGDRRSFSIAAASIIAKVSRDRMMEKWDAHYKPYDFSKNKGYGVPKHKEALIRFGLSPIHRKTFVSEL